MDQQDSDTGDVDLASSLSHLHTSLRTIGARAAAPIANGFHSLNLTNSSAEKRGEIPGGGLSGAKVAEKVFDYVMRYTNLQV